MSKIHTYKVNRIHQALVDHGGALLWSNGGKLYHQVLTGVAIDQVKLPKHFSPMRVEGEIANNGTYITPLSFVNGWERGAIFDGELELHTYLATESEKVSSSDYINNTDIVLNGTGIRTNASSLEPWLGGRSKAQLNDLRKAIELREVEKQVYLLNLAMDRLAKEFVEIKKLMPDYLFTITNLVTSDTPTFLVDTKDKIKFDLYLTLLKYCKDDGCTEK